MCCPKIEQETRISFRSKFSKLFHRTCQTARRLGNIHQHPPCPTFATAVVPDDLIVRLPTQFCGLRLCLRNVKKSDDVCASIRCRWPPSGVATRCHFRLLNFLLRFASRPDSLSRLILHCILPCSTLHIPFNYILLSR